MTSQITTLTAALKEQEVETAGLKAELAAQTRDYESLKQERQAAEEEEEERTQRVAVDGMQVDEDAVTATPLSSSARAGAAAAAAAGGQATKPLHSDDERLPPMVVADDDDDAAAEHEVGLSPPPLPSQSNASQRKKMQRSAGSVWVEEVDEAMGTWPDCDAPVLSLVPMCPCVSVCLSVFVASPG